MSVIGVNFEVTSMSSLLKTCEDTNSQTGGKETGCLLSRLDLSWTGSFYEEKGIVSWQGTCFNPL